MSPAHRGQANLPNAEVGSSGLDKMDFTGDLNQAWSLSGQEHEAHCQGSTVGGWKRPTADSNPMYFLVLICSCLVQG